MSTRYALIPLVGIVLFTVVGPFQTGAQSRTTSGTATLDDGGFVRVENNEGRIAVDTWDRPKVRYEAVVRPDEDAEHPDATVVQVDSSDRRLILDTEYDESKDESEGVFGGLFGIGASRTVMPVEYTLTVPRRARVEIDDYESTIQVQNLEAHLRIDTFDGAVTVTGQSGEAELESNDGDVTVVNQSGPLEIDVDDSDIRLRAVKGRTEVESDDAHGQIDIAALTGALDIETDAGTFTISLPPEAGFALETVFDEGASLKTDFDLAPYQLSSQGQEEINYEGAVHGGGPRLRLTAGDASFELRPR